MTDKSTGLGDVIKANTSEKVDLALGAASWYGWYLIGRGLRKMFSRNKIKPGMLKDAKRNEGNVNWDLL